VAGKHYRKRPLQPKQVAFKLAYLRQPLGQRSPEKAALEAGYSPKTAAEQGRRLMLHPQIREELMMEHPERARELADIDAAWVLHELAELWRVPLSAIFHEDGTLKNITDIPPEAQKLIAGFEVVESSHESEAGGSTVLTRVGKIKLVDRLRVLEDLGKLTKVNAFGTGSQANANESLAELMRAFTVAMANPKSTREVDITPTERIK